MQCSKPAMLGTIGQQKVYERGTFSVKTVYKKARLDLDGEPSIKTSLSTPAGLKINQTRERQPFYGRKMYVCTHVKITR